MIKALFIAGFGPVTTDAEAAKKLYVDALGISFDQMESGYLHTDKMEGARYFALWPLSQAAESCFGTKSWPSDVPVPQAWIEFEVENVESATYDFEKRGYKLLVAARREPWGQTVTRFISPEGLLVGIVYTPWMRGEQQ